jgi:hypothetical protein
MTFLKKFNLVYKRNSAGFVITFAIMTLALVGCTHNAPYNVMIRNSGVSKIGHSQVEFGQKSISGGWVMPGYSTTYLDQTVSIPEKAVVRWQRGTSVFEKEVLVKNLLPARPYNEYYTLIFVIDEDEHVEVKVVLCNQNLPCPELYQK